MTFPKRAPNLVVFLLALAWLTLPPALKGHTYFEPSAGDFNAQGGRVLARIEPSGVLLANGTGKPTPLRWTSANPARLQGEQQTGGYTNYYVGPDPAAWRVKVPHFNAVRARNLYAGIDILFRSKDEAFEFDARLKPYADLNLPGFDLTPLIAADGTLRLVGSGLLVAPLSDPSTDRIPGLFSLPRRTREGPVDSGRTR